MNEYQQFSNFLFQKYKIYQCSHFCGKFYWRSWKIVFINNVTVFLHFLILKIHTSSQFLKNKIDDLLTQQQKHNCFKNNYFLYLLDPPLSIFKHFFQKINLLQSKMYDKSKMGHTEELLEMLQCGICTYKYDESQHKPIVFCLQMHTLCETCLNDIMRKPEEHRKCPFCRAQVLSKNQPNRYIKMVQNISSTIIKKENQLKEMHLSNKKEQEQLRKDLSIKLKQVGELKEKFTNAEENISIYKANEINLREIMRNIEGDLDEKKKKIIMLEHELKKSAERQQSVRKELEKLKETNRKITSQLSEKQKVLSEMEREELQLDQSHQRLKDIQLNFYLKLQKLYINDNLIDSIDLSKNTRLEQLGMWNNALTSINLSKNTRLYYLNIDNNKLGSISLIENRQLTTISLSGNKLQQVKVFCKKEMNVDIDSQATSDCSVTILYSTEQLKDCEAIQSKLKLRYCTPSDQKSTIKKRNILNKYNCNYSIEIMKIK